jgi:hypothetical protein
MKFPSLFEIALSDERIYAFRREEEAGVRLPIVCTDALKTSEQSSTLIFLSESKRLFYVLGTTRYLGIAIDDHLKLILKISCTVCDISHAFKRPGDCNSVNKAGPKC